MTKTNCRYCGLGFEYPRQFGKVKYCSSRCRVSHLPPREPWEYKGCYTGDYYSKKRRRRMAAGDRVDYLVIYDHYDWTCHLCHGTIDKMLMYPDPMCATIDHVVPLSGGGRHEWLNLAPAHLYCNSKKNDQ